MDRIRITAAHFQLGFIGFVLACRLIASLVESAETPAFPINHGTETGRVEAPA